MYPLTLSVITKIAQMLNVCCLARNYLLTFCAGLCVFVIVFGVVLRLGFVYIQLNVTYPFFFAVARIEPYLIFDFDLHMVRYIQSSNMN